MKVSTNIIHRVYNDDDGDYLNVGPDSDDLCMVEINAYGNKENWGGFDRLAMHPAYARAVAHAILAAAHDIEAAERDAGNTQE